jgi:hypothetical protein
MACQRCIGRQRKLVRLLCRNPDSYLCRKAQERLARMLASLPEGTK